MNKPEKETERVVQFQIETHTANKTEPAMGVTDKDTNTKENEMEKAHPKGDAKEKANDTTIEKRTKAALDDEQASANKKGTVINKTKASMGITKKDTHKKVKEMEKTLRKEDLQEKVNDTTNEKSTKAAPNEAQISENKKGKEITNEKDTDGKKDPENEDDDDDDHEKPEEEVGLILRSRSGRQMVVVKGHKFFNERERGWKIEWRCSKRTTLGCKANIMTIKDKIVRRQEEHNHTTDPDYLKYGIFRE